MARYCPLFSGSSGNCTYIGTAEGGILVDAGVSAKRIETALRERDIDPQSIQAVFVTHEHIDHVSGLRVLTKRYGWRVYGSCGTLEAIADTRPLDPHTVCEVIGEEGVCAAGMEIRPFATSHDSRESLGFRITLPDERRVAIATDTTMCGCWKTGRIRIISSAGSWRIRGICPMMRVLRSWPGSRSGGQPALCWRT